MDFAQIFRDVARIFNKSKLLGVRLHPLHPRLQHHWLNTYFLLLTVFRTSISQKYTTSSVCDLITCSGKFILFQNWKRFNNSDTYFS